MTVALLLSLFLSHLPHTRSLLTQPPTRSMLRLSLLALLAVSSSSSLALASPQPSFLSDLLTSATTTAHKLLGQKVCPLPAFLPESCVGNQSVATVYPRLKLDACCTEIPGGRLLSTQFWDTGKTSVGPNSSWTRTFPFLLLFSRSFSSFCLIPGS